MTAPWPMRPLSEEEFNRLDTANSAEARYFHAKSFLEEWRKEVMQK
ncbi:MAG: hypothetical protein KGI38_11725 [Thaumarchaeota archaeon]|nr:hypothetical protein [Nitrososphaerota archaeon]